MVYKLKLVHLTKIYGLAPYMKPSVNLAVGVNITRDEKKNIIEMTQTGLIDSILDDIGLNSVDKNCITKETPSSQILQQGRDGAERHQSRS